MAAIVVEELPRSFDPTVSEWGNPVYRNVYHRVVLYNTGGTRGTEISKYPEEKKTKVIPLVSDERTGISPNLRGAQGNQF